MTIRRDLGLPQSQGLLHRVRAGIKPFHGIVFGGMQHNIAEAAERGGPAHWKPSRKSS